MPNSTQEPRNLSEAMLAHQEAFFAWQEGEGSAEAVTAASEHVCTFANRLKGLPGSETLHKVAMNSLDIVMEAMGE